MEARQIIVKNSAGIPIEYLTKDDLVYDAWVEERQNHESKLSLSFSNLSKKIYVVFDLNNEFHIDGKVFTLLNEDAVTVERTTDNKIITNVIAIESWQSELETSYNKVYNSTTGFDHIDEHMVVIVSGGSDLSNGKYEVGSAGHALYALLQGTGWSLKECNVTGKFDLETDKKSTLSNIYAVQELWGGIIIWDSKNHTLSLLQENLYEPFNGFQIKYGCNLKHIAKSISNKVITRAYVYGEKNLNIASVNDNKEYLDDFTYSTKIRKGIINNTNINKAEHLKQWGLRQLATLSKPQETYKTSIVDLSTLDEYKDVPFKVNDMCNVIDNSIVGSVPMKKRIVYKKYNVFFPCLCELEIGDNQDTLTQELKKTTASTTSIGSTRNNNNKWDGYLDEKGVEEKITLVNEDWVNRLDAVEKAVVVKLNKDGEFTGSINWSASNFIKKNVAGTGIDIKSADVITLDGPVSIGGALAVWKQITYKNSAGVDETSWVLSKV